MPETKAEMPQTTRRRADRVILRGVDWKTYARLGRVLENRPGVRLTYDRGTLEIMTLTLFGHEAFKRLLGRLISALTYELRLPIAEGGSTTCRRQIKKRGLEPDECYWIANAPRVRGKKRLDLRVDPPPDLALEVDLTSSSLDRMGIYAVLGVPELWRVEEERLAFYVLQPEGNYAVATTSLSFPGLTADDLMTFIALDGKEDLNDIFEQFHRWLRQRFHVPPRI